MHPVKHLAGLERLRAVSGLLQRMRLKAPSSGVWEAADVQWWWRRARASDALALPVWFDDSGRPVATALLTAWPKAWWLDLLRLPGLDLPLDVWAAPALAMLEQEDGAAPGQPAMIKSLVPADDAELAAWFIRHGFEPAGESWSGWQPAAQRAGTEPLPEGYRLVDRAARGADAAPTHPMVARNGPEVEARLRQTPLYDPRLDLAVLAPDGTVAAYALFWHDPLTGVGLVEPVRVEDPHAGRGIATAMIGAGLDRLAGAGASRWKIGWESERAGALYARLGFNDRQTFTTWQRPARRGR